MDNLFSTVNILGTKSELAHQLITFICYVLSVKILTWQVHIFIPKTINDYGFEYFGFSKPYYPSLSLKLLQSLVACILLYWYASIYKLDPLTLPFLALVISSSIGILTLDVKFRLIPDRFQFLGLIGAVGIAANKLLPFSKTLPSDLYETLLALGLPAALYLSSFLYEKVRNRVGMGFGDIKLLLWLAILFGMQLYPIFIVTVALALLSKLPRILITLINRNSSLKQTVQDPFAFAPHIISACLIWSIVRPVIFYSA